MKKTILFIGIIIFCGAITRAQTGNDSILQLQERILKLETLNSKLLKQVIESNNHVVTLEKRLITTADSMTSIRQELAVTNSNLNVVTANLQNQINQLSSKTDSSLSALNNKIGTTTILTITGVALIMLLIGVLFGVLISKLSKTKEELSEQLKKYSAEVKEMKSVPDSLLAGIFENRKEPETSEEEKPVEIDHRLALKVADEIIRIQKNLNNIDPETKGLKQVVFALERIQDYFTEYGYEMVELLNKQYDQNMNLTAKFRSDATITQGQKIITRIIKPQINYNGTIIQPAEVEVSVGEREGIFNP